MKNFKDFPLTRLSSSKLGSALWEVKKSAIFLLVATMFLLSGCKKESSESPTASWGEGVDFRMQCWEVGSDQATLYAICQRCDDMECPKHHKCGIYFCTEEEGDPLKNGSYAECTLSERTMDFLVTISGLKQNTKYRVIGAVDTYEFGMCYSNTVEFTTNANNQ